MKTSKSVRLFEKTKKIIPGGVNSPVRAFTSVGLTPRFIQRGKGAYIWDVDGNRYLDYVGSWGPLLFGHAHPRIVRAIQQTARRGTSFGAPTELEEKVAGLICSMIPSIEMVRMVNSGTEATMSAIRLARAFTGKDAIIKFKGCYHGHGDSFLIKAGSGAMTLGVPDSPGVPKSLAAETLLADYNDLESVQRLVRHHSTGIAAIIVEPIVGNFGCVLPKNNFLYELRELCSREKILLIFDEVMTGFRVARGGAQELYHIQPDLTTLGKIIGGGLPVGAYGGRRDIMAMVAPSGPMYQAGTLSGNPLAMAAGYEMLRMINAHPTLYASLERRGSALEDGITDIMRDLDLRYCFHRIGSMFTIFFTPEDVYDFESAQTCDRAKFALFFSRMIERGIYLPPSQFEAAFISSAHTNGDIEKTLSAIRQSLKNLQP